MAVLILKNVFSEGPGTIEEHLLESAIPYTVCELGSGETPPSLDGYGTVVMLGGPMGVYEMQDYPHLRIASRLLREAIDREMKVLGVCLGAQLLAQCLGARVYKGHAQEVGWLDIELSADGLKDALMRKLAMHPAVGDFWKRFKVFQWHGDTFDMPMGAIRLAGSKMYENQAFKYGHAYAFQFHIEVTEAMLGDWFAGEPENAGKIMNDARALSVEYSGRARNFYKSFFEG